MNAVRYDVEEEVAVVTIDRPDQRNALDRSVRVALIEAFHRAEADESVAAVVLTGRGSAFCSGIDLADGARQRDGETVSDVYLAIHEMDKPVIAAVNGPAAGAGCGLALSADIRIAASSAYFMWPHASLGLTSVSGPVLLTRQVPRNIALELMFTGRRMSAHEAERWGVVNRVCDDGDARETAVGIAQQIIIGSRPALRRIKSLTRLSQGLPIAEAIAEGKRYVAEDNEKIRTGRQADDTREEKTT